ncbi:MAG: endopeptidase La [Desulfobacterales bacterium]|nr:endopeptidase La [Desulfobacterales bacterium]MCP4158454.1 endopeptidase La [Deltaproteobacteria bacterium]
MKTHQFIDVDPKRVPSKIPILPLYDVVLFPKMVLPLLVVKEESKALIKEVLDADGILGVLVAKESELVDTYTVKDLYDVGTVAIIIKVETADTGETQIMLQGISRFKIENYVADSHYFSTEMTMVEDSVKTDKETKALMSNILKLYDKLVTLSPTLPDEIAGMANTIEEPGILADMIASTINCSCEEKQEILQTFNPKKRLKKVTKLINYQLEVLEMGTKIQSQVQEDIGNKQREYYLREQLKAIREELGEAEDAESDVDEYRERLAKMKLPKEAEKEAERELKRLSRMPSSSSEYTVASTYLDWITTLPWDKKTLDKHNIKDAKKILDDDHFGLDKAKKRIIEYLAVRKLKPDSKGPILCFSGPPGTGKTSLGKSIAKSLGREYVRLALGGVRDEAEIRGHRRTYVGALPGRIIQGIRRAETKNPVFVLDEIDKVGNSYQGDPSSALLEVLDPEQNFSFSDHYLDVPFDLSEVMFLTTANVLHTIPSALRDRMEVIELLGYTEDEKVKITKKYLIPRQRRAHGLMANQIAITTGAIKHIISGYTREAGLRNLEREIAAICRGVASKIAEGLKESVSIKVMNVAKFLGPVKAIPEMSERIVIPGVVMGLAWTPAGGDLLFIEATAMAGNQGLLLTGQLGSVMKESVQTALSFIRTHAIELDIPEDYFKKHDIHVHVPQGAIPKDGPSAGVTMLTALTSLITNRKVIKKLAMTGEITLRGQVLPVGGVKEKILAAHRSGIKVIIMPKTNQNDLDEIPKKVLKALNIHFVERMSDVLKLALEKRNGKERRAKNIYMTDEKRGSTRRTTV